MKNKFKWSLLAAVAMAATVAMAADKYISSSGNVVIKTATSKSVNLQDTLYTTQAGNVGVGTSTPAGKFDVNSLFTVLSNGSVGIGNTAPTSKLWVGHSGASASPLVIGDPTTISSDTGIYLRTNGVAYVGTSSALGSLALNYHATLAGGNVGVGVIPQAKLDVKPTGIPTADITTGSQMVGIRMVDGLADVNTKVGVWANLGSLQSGMVFGRQSSGWGTFVAFHTHPLATSGLDNLTERMRIDSEGAVGINTTTPVTGTKLDVSGAGGGVVMPLSGYVSGGVPARVWKINMDSAGLGFRYNANAEQLKLFQDGTVVLSTLTTNGPVYSNTAPNPTYGGTLTNSNPSDLRLKKNVTDLTLGLDVVTKLRPVSYKWKHDNHKALGFIAQDVEKVVPQLVKTEANGMKGLYSDQFTPILVKAIQEQQKIIELQKAWMDLCASKCTRRTLQRELNELLPFLL
jgi:hypothetical protein